MRHKYVNLRQTDRSARAFTLIELLVVVSIISILLAILMPALGAARAWAKRTVCLADLRDIALGWQLYLHDNDGAFYQGNNTNHDFGGWEGTGGYDPIRPLNTYVGLDPNIPIENGAELFRCPADSGLIAGGTPIESAYQYFGNSYQTNLFLIGPTAIGPPSASHAALHSAINSRLKNLKQAAVSTSPDLLVLVGDNNWISEWVPVTPHSKDWHGKSRHHCMAFLDGHTDFVKIRKGLYVTSEYTIVPFRDLLGLATSVQVEVP
jgi:prepilin-type N-terminal cleavage/methylation domain-containing protein